jgi:hypothetical protein
MDGPQQQLKGRTESSRISKILNTSFHPKDPVLSNRLLWKYEIVMH